MQFRDFLPLPNLGGGAGGYTPEEDVIAETLRPRTEPGTLWQQAPETSWVRILRRQICILGPALPVLPLETQPCWEEGTAAPQHNYS